MRVTVTLNIDDAELEGADFAEVEASLRARLGEFYPDNAEGVSIECPLDVVSVSEGV